ncbi:nephrin-like isoform X2 [Mya arenaria]|uniref:nephrin-like isoform X2 n=1 Tax=Mya arenaria TaxID=6604 RepID=UPI0022E0B21E|nr:nephrin-like isoform X2 [Mya arenaria]
MENMFIRALAVISFTMVTKCKGTVLVTSDQQYAPLNGQITLTCNVDMDGVQDVNFKRGSTQRTQLGSCDIFGCQTSNAVKYSTSKNSEPSGYDLFYLTIKDFRETDSDDYHCEVAANRNSGSKYITYAVGITSVTLTPNTDPISVIENVQQQFTCVTSVSRPAAVVKWYLDDKQVTSGIFTATSQDVTTSTLTYTPERIHHDRGISCQGSNGGQDLISTNKPTLNILYGPSVPACTYDGSAMPSLIKVREGWEVRLECNSDGNPSPTLSWSHPGGGLSSPLVLSNFKRTHDGIFNISARSYLVPSFQQTANLSSSVKTTVQVLYPPDAPSCRVGSSTITSSTIYAVRGKTISMNCSCNSNPAPNYSWSMTGVSSSTSGQYIQLPIQDRTTVTLTLENTMQFTNGSTEQGRRESTFEVNVLFPPVVKPLANVVALERGNISVACQITAGVPNNTDFKWERIFDMIQVSMEQTLGIINIGRTQSGYYRCTASNLMEPTGYDATFGNSSNTVYIDVQYEAEVTNFTLSNSNHGQNFEVNENTKVIFYCQAKSNPLPNISLLKQSQYLKSATNTNDLEFTISESVCEDDGTYQCTAQNTHNTQADVRSLTLFVRCAPRATTLAPINHNVRSATGVPAVLTLKLVAFPRPSVKDFLWEKKDLATNTWHIVADDTYIDIIISEDGLQTELFFRSVEEKDFGSYIVHVNNELGTYSETFRLLAQERPHTPFNLQHLKNGTIDTVHIEWTPGFDGGLPQTFHVEYRDVETSVWRNDMVNTGKISHVIVGLSPNTIYEIRVYSTNDIGRSNVSNAIEVTTLKRPETDIPPNHAPVVGGAVGGSLGAIFAAVVLVLILRRKYTLHCSCNMSLSTKEDEHSGRNGHGDENQGYNAAVTYEVVSATKETPVYDALNVGNDGPENSQVYMPLEDSNPHVYYENVERDDAVYKNTVLKNPVQTVL